MKKKHNPATLPAADGVTSARRLASGGAKLRRPAASLPLFKGLRAYAAAVLALTLMFGVCTAAYAADDPLTVVSNLSDFSAPVSGR